MWIQTTGERKTGLVPTVWAVYPAGIGLSVFCIIIYIKNRLREEVAMAFEFQLLAYRISNAVSEYMAGLYSGIRHACLCGIFSYTITSYAGYGAECITEYDGIARFSSACHDLYAKVSGAGGR